MHICHGQTQGVAFCVRNMYPGDRGQATGARQNRTVSASWVVGDKEVGFSFHWTAVDCGIHEDRASCL